MFDLEKCRKQGWKVLVHTDDGWRVGDLCFLRVGGGSMKPEMISEFDQPEIANLPELPEKKEPSNG